MKQYDKDKEGDGMYIADLHIHSRYSRATSKDCTPEFLDLWARRKGIHIVGTGDFTHPAWREELSEKLEPAEEGLYVLKEEYRIKEGAVPGSSAAPGGAPRFVITGEISSIYKKGGRVRKVHSVILLPGLEDAERISAKLEQIGNIHSDGRPILGLDCHDLLEIVLELCPSAVYVPAHIWTPHFSLFGAFSGFDSMEECFGDLTPHIHAVETGLSSDPPMNWRVSVLDKYQLISNSDAHSPAKLGREANLLDIPLSYEGLSRAIQTGEGLYGTIEFFPEEGKYHMDGHRKCSLCLSPSETMKYNGICPVCGRKITVGVSHRVEELADRPENYVRPGAKAFESLVPLPEVLAASLGCSAASKKVTGEYMNMISKLGPEFEILREIPLEEIRSAAGSRTAEGIARLRRGEVERIPGFDGEYGIIRLFSTEELENTEGQMNFFDMLRTDSEPAASAGEKTEKIQKGAEHVAQKTEHAVESMARSGSAAKTPALNREQAQAVTSLSPRIAVKAGPGTGKTKTLVSRLAYLLENRRVRPSGITAVTFTNQAAAEMKERIGRETGRKQASKSMQIGTFHAICLTFLKDQGEQFFLAGDAQLKEIAERVLGETGLGMDVREFLEAVSRMKSGMTVVMTGEAGDCREKEEFEKAFLRYEEKKAENALFDFDDLLLKTAEKIESGNAAPGWEKRFQYLLVDEFQDINPLQHRLIRLWHAAGRELFVIGDPDQSIYGFRGADASCFERLLGEYPDIEEIVLRENYRSTPQILSAAETVIRAGGMSDAGERGLRANCPAGEPVRIAQSKGPMGQAVFIAKEIGSLAGGIGMLEAHRTAWERDGQKMRGFGDIAVLCRTNRQTELLEKCMRKEGIPCIVAGREEFLKENCIQGSISFFQYLSDPQNRPAMEQSARLLWELEWNPVTEEIVRNAGEKFREPFRKKKPEQFLKVWLEEMQFTGNEAMEKFRQMALFHKSMNEFLDALKLGVESDLKRCGNKKYISEAVTLMTMHGSKGLEFPVVFLFGADRGMIPLEGGNHSTDLEEERRLFYVGITRAKEELIITTGEEPSEFLEELRDRGPEWTDMRKEKEEEFHQMSLFE